MKPTTAEYLVTLTRRCWLQAEKARLSNKARTINSNAQPVIKDNLVAELRSLARLQRFSTGLTETGDPIAVIVALPGVGRKTANVVLGTAYGIASGVVVDTHVMRLSRRLDLTKHEEPKKIEEDRRSG